MRHKVKGRKLSRTAAHRKATMRALTAALVKEHRITTTLAKAKELRRFVEPLITRAKEDTHHNRRQVFSSVQNKETVKYLFEDVGPAAADRPGGYTRVIRVGHRYGDSAEMAVIELVDYNDIQPEGTSGKRKKTRRAGKSNTPTSATPEETKTSEAADETAAEAEEEVKAETTEEEIKNEEAASDADVAGEDTSEEETEEK